MSQVISQWGQLAREWSERGRRDIDHRTRGARVREREANASTLSELAGSSWLGVTVEVKRSGQHESRQLNESDEIALCVFCGRNQFAAPYVSDFPFGLGTSIQKRLQTLLNTADVVVANRSRFVAVRV